MSSEFTREECESLRQELKQIFKTIEKLNNKVNLLQDQVTNTVDPMYELYKKLKLYSVKRGWSSPSTTDNIGVDVPKNTSASNGTNDKEEIVKKRKNGEEDGKKTKKTKLDASSATALSSLNTATVPHAILPDAKKTQKNNTGKKSSEEQEMSSSSVSKKKMKLDGQGNKKDSNEQGKQQSSFSSSATADDIIKTTSNGNLMTGTELEQLIKAANALGLKLINKPHLSGCIRNGGAVATGDGGGGGDGDGGEKEENRKVLAELKNRETGEHFFYRVARDKQKEGNVKITLLPKTWIGKYFNEFHAEDHEVYRINLRVARKFGNRYGRPNGSFRAIYPDAYYREKSEGAEPDETIAAANMDTLLQACAKKEVEPPQQKEIAMESEPDLGKNNQISSSDQLKSPLQTSIIDLMEEDVTNASEIHLVSKENTNACVPVLSFPISTSSSPTVAGTLDSYFSTSHA